MNSSRGGGLKVQGQGRGGDICCHFCGQMPRFDKCLSEDYSSRNLRVLFLAGRRDCSCSFGETADRSLESGRANKAQPWIMGQLLLFYLAGSSSTRTLKTSHTWERQQFHSSRGWSSGQRSTESLRYLHHLKKHPWPSAPRRGMEAKKPAHFH